jgi:hypothetical protein
MFPAQGRGEALVWDDRGRLATTTNYCKKTLEDRDRSRCEEEWDRSRAQQVRRRAEDYEEGGCMHEVVNQSHFPAAAGRWSRRLEKANRCR